MRIGIEIAALFWVGWLAAVHPGAARASLLVGALPDAADADLVLWLDADSLRLEAGAPVESWPDRSLRRHDVFGRAGSRALPTFVPNRLNGLPGVHFDGAARTLQVAGDVDLGQEHTIVVVAQRSATRQGIGGLVSYAANSRGMGPQGSEVDLAVDAQRGLRCRYPGIDAAQALSSERKASFDRPAVFAQVRAAPSVRGYIDDAVEPVLNVSASAREISPIRKTLRIGAFGREGSYLDGDVFEVLVYRRALSPLELSELFGYLKTKWLPDQPAPAITLFSADAFAPKGELASPSLPRPSREDARAQQPRASEVPAPATLEQSLRQREQPRASDIVVPTTLEQSMRQRVANALNGWYRDRGATAFDLLDGALDFYYRGVASSRWESDSFRALEADGGAAGLAFALRSVGSDALELSLRRRDSSGVEAPVVSASASGLKFAAAVSYHVAVTVATDRKTGQVTLRLFGAPQDVSIDTTSPQFELASATSAGLLDGPRQDALKRAFAGAASGGAVERATSGQTALAASLRVWRGVPGVFRAPERFPDVVDRVHPEPEPAYPAEFDPFEPPLGAAAPARGAPQVAEWTRSGTATDTFVVTGERLSAQNGAAEGEDSAFTVFGQSAETLGVDEAEVLRLKGRRAAIRIGVSVPPAAMYLVWPRNERGYGRPFAVNQAEAWWIGPSRAARAQSVSLYGRNLSYAGGTSRAFVYVKARAGGPGRWLPPSAVNPYKVDFAVPADWPDGEYEVWAHNGHGGRYGWSRPVSLIVNGGTAWNGRTFEVAADGSDEALDDAAIQEALDAAAESARSTGSNATVRFAAGTFHVSRTIELPSNVRLIGSGRDATILRGKGEFVGRGHMLWINGVHTNELAELTLDFGTAAHPGDNFLLSGRSEDLLVRDVRFVALGPDQYVLYHSPQRASFRDCDFVGPFVLLIDSFQVAFERCHFYGARDSVLLYLSAGARELSVTRCTGQDYDIARRSLPDGWAQGRFVNVVNRTRISRDLYIAENVTHDLGVSPNYSNQNTGEQISWDEAQGQFIANALVAANDPRSDTGTLQFKRPLPPLDAEHSWIAVVISGPGEGQTRDVLGVEGGRVRVSPRWNVLPERDSRIALGSFHERAVVYRNRLDGKIEQVAPPDHTASTGIEPYGGMSNFIADANGVRDCRFGIYVMGTSSDTPSEPMPMLPSLFHLYANNLIQSARTGFYVGTGGTVPGQIAGFAFLFRGNVFLNTLFSLGYIMQDPRMDNLDMIVLDRTSGFDTPVGFSFNGPGAAPSDVGSVLLMGSRLDRGAAPAGNSSAVVAATDASEPAPATHLWSQHNHWTNFARDFIGSPAAPPPDLPVRHLFASARTRAASVSLRFTVLNNATGEQRYPLDIPVSAKKWLRAAEPLPSIRAHDSASYELQCDPSQLTPGLYQTSIGVGNRERKRSLAVTFRVLP